MSDRPSLVLLLSVALVPRILRNVDQAECSSPSLWPSHKGYSSMSTRPNRVLLLLVVLVVKVPPCVCQAKRLLLSMAIAVKVLLHVYQAEPYLVLPCKQHRSVP